MDPDDASAEIDTASGTPQLEEAPSADAAAAFQALAEMFANAKGPGCPHRQYLLERIDGQLVFRQTEADAAVEIAIADVFGSAQSTSNRRRIIKLL